MSKTKPGYEVVISEQTLDSIKAYHRDLILGKKTPGSRLARQLQENHKSIENLSTEEFIEEIVNTKEYLIFAESADTGKQWNALEAHILGDIGINMPNVKIFDDGAYGGKSSIKNYDKPLDGGLLFIPGALLDDKVAGDTSDVAELVKNGKIDQIAYNKFIERRLLPLFVEASRQAGQEGRTAEINVPNLGGASFAGKFKGTVGHHTNIAIQAMLEKHAKQLENISYVRLATDDTNSQDKQVGNIRYEVKHSKGDGPGVPILSLSPEAKGSPPPKLFKLIAADHKSYPGNDFFRNSRVTDEGMTAAATNSMEVLTGLQGKYDTKSHRYLPPNNKTWEQVANENKVSLQVKGNIRIISNDAKSLSLTEYEKQHGTNPTISTPSPYIPSKTIKHSTISKPVAPIPTKSNTEVMIYSARVNDNSKPKLALQFNSLTQKNKFINDMIIKGNEQKVDLHNLFEIDPNRPNTLFVKNSNGNTGTYKAGGGELAISFSKNAELANYFQKRLGLDQIAGSNFSSNGAIYFTPQALPVNADGHTNLKTNENEHLTMGSTLAKRMEEEGKGMMLTPSKPLTPPKSKFDEPITIHDENEEGWHKLMHGGDAQTRKEVQIYSARVTDSTQSKVALKFYSDKEKNEFINNMVQEGKKHGVMLRGMFEIPEDNNNTLYIKHSNGKTGTYSSKNDELAVSFGKGNIELSDYFYKQLNLKNVKGNNYTADGAVYFDPKHLPIKADGKTNITATFDNKTPKHSISPGFALTD